MLHFPVSLMNRLNKTESVVFQLCRFTVLPNHRLFRAELCIGSVFINKILSSLRSRLPVKLTVLGANPRQVYKLHL